MEQKDPLLNLVNSRDPLGYSLLKERYSRPIYNGLLRLTSKTDAIADAVSYALAKLWFSDTRFASNARIYSFLRVSAYNRCIDEIRRDKINDRYLREQFYLANGDEGIVEETDAEIKKDVVKEIEKVLFLLSPRQRQIIFMVLVEGKKIDQIAKELNISKKTASNIKSRATEKIRLLLNKKV